MAVDIKEALTRKLGPLPAWGWGVALGGGILAFRFIRGGASSGEQAASSGTPTFVNPAPTELGQQESGFLSGLSGQLDSINARLDDMQSKPSGYLPPVALPFPLPHFPDIVVGQPPATTTQPTSSPVPIAAPTPAPAASAPTPVAVSAANLAAAIRSPAALPAVAPKTIVVAKPAPSPASSYMAPSFPAKIVAAAIKAAQPKPKPKPSPASSYMAPPKPVGANTRKVGGFLES